MRLGKESEVGVPILVEGEAWGEVYATTAPGQPRFRGEDVRFLETVAGQLAVAIGRAELFSRVSRLAYEDPLTGLANRRALEERLQRAVARAADRNVPLAVLLCDVDELKAINDEAGHDAGDRALQRVGGGAGRGRRGAPGQPGRPPVRRRVLRRHGGRDASSDARALAAATLATLGDPDDEAILISCGAAALGRGVDTLAELMRAADAALYRAKRNGGGQIFTAGSRASDVTPRPERRTLRRTTQERVRDAVQELTERFDGRPRPRGRRWSASRRSRSPCRRRSTPPRGRSPSRRPAATRSTRSRPPTGATSASQGLHLGLDNEVYSVDEYPATARLLEAGAGAFVARVDDQTRRPRRAHAARAARAHQRAGRRRPPTTTSPGCWSCTADEPHGPARGGRASRPGCCCAPRSRRARRARVRALRERWARQVGPDQRARRTAGARRRASRRWCEAAVEERARGDGRATRPP